MKIIRTGPLSVNTLIVPLTGNKVFVVDAAACRFSRDENVISRYLESEKLEPVAFIFTHGHFDHVSGLSFLHSVYPDSDIAIHKEDSAMIGEASESIQGISLGQMGFDIFLPYVSNLPDPTHFLEDGKNLSEIFAPEDDELKSAFSKWKVIHTPGHTSGCVCLYNSCDKVLISGDTLFYRSWGRTDLYGGSEPQIMKSLEKLSGIVTDDTAVYPGHDYSGFLFKDRF